MTLTWLFSGFCAVCGQLMLFSLVSCHSSSACEGIRSCGTRLLAAMVFYMSPVIYAHLTFSFFLFMLIVIVIFVPLLIRWMTFIP